MNDSQRYAVYHANDVLETNLPPAMRWYADKSMYYTHVADVVAPLRTDLYPDQSHRPSLDGQPGGGLARHVQDTIYVGR